MEVALSRRDVRSALALLLLIDLLLVLAYLLERSIGSPLWLLRRLADLDGEASVAAWFSSMQLCLVGLVVLLKARRPGTLAPVGGVFLYGIAATFFFLSADEALSLHESITAGLKHVSWLPRFHGHGIWIPIYLAAVLAFLFTSYRRVRFLWLHSQRQSAMVFGGFALFLLGAVGLEMIGYQAIESTTSLAYVVEVACEEGLEMAGVSVILAGALGFLAQEAPRSLGVGALAAAPRSPGL